MQSEPLQLIIKEAHTNVEMTDCICNACRIKYKKKVKSSSYTPEKSRAKKRDPCFLTHYMLCTELSHRECECTLDSFNAAFSLQCSSIPNSIALCLIHRRNLSRYMETQYFSNCSVCEGLLKADSKRYACSVLSVDDAKELCQINETFSITNDGVLCQACYSYSRRHSTRMKKQSFEELEKEFIKDSMNTDDGTDEQLLNKILNIVFLHVCKLCKEDGCFLFSTIYEYLMVQLNAACNDDRQQYRLHKSPVYLKGRILHRFGKLLNVHKAARKKGLFFYRAEMTLDDIINAWHMAHSKLRAQKRGEVSEEEGTSSDFVRSEESQFNTSSDGDLSFRRTITDFNESLRKQGKFITEQFLKNPLSVIDFDINKACSMFNPYVWNTICGLTATVDELSSFRQSDIQVYEEFITFKSDSTQAGRKRKHRRVAAVFLLQFLMNDENSYPFHIVMANYIKKLSHSSKLLKTLNNIGFACSESTLDRFLQYIHDRRVEAGPLSQLQPTAFTLVSIDNIDVLTPFAAVEVDKTRSWHGTSIMAQQPKPLTETLHRYEQLDTIEPDESVNSIPSCSTGAETQSTNVKNAPAVVKKPSVRRRTAQLESLDIPGPSSFNPPLNKTSIRSQLSAASFELSEEETLSEKKINRDIMLYITERYHYILNDIPTVIPGLKCKLSLENEKYVEKSQFSYMYILNEKADCPATLKRSLGLLYDSFGVNKKINHLVIAGDGATVRLLLNLKAEYGESLDWMIPYLGEWHILKNFQEVLMKIFWDAGLKEIAKQTHKQMTLNSLGNCSNFKRTHRFLLQVYEAIFMFQFQCFLDHRDKDTQFSKDHFLQEVGKLVSNIEYEDGNFKGLPDFLLRQEQFFDQYLLPLQNEYVKYCKEMSDKYETFKFWNQFLFNDCLCYIHLWIAIRSGNWNLRNAAFKAMAPLFYAFDRQNYSYLIPAHIRMLHTLPEYILDHFRSGAFVCSISGANFSKVPPDETHEMTINKDCKVAFSNHLPLHVEKMCATLQCQAQLVTQLEEQIGVSRKGHLQRDLQKSVINSEFANVKSYFHVVCKTSMFIPNQPESLFHVFTNVSASPVQQKSLLSYRELGEEAYLSFCKIQLLQDTSVKKPVKRKFKLRTFSKEKVRARKVIDLEKEKRLITLCYKRTLAFSQERQMPVSNLCQFIEAPRAICSPSGLPNKGAKSVIYDHFDKRFTSDYQIISNTLSFSDSDVCIIIEGMNIIYTSPLRHFKVFEEYAQFLIRRWMHTYFRRGYKEV